MMPITSVMAGINALPGLLTSVKSTPNDAAAESAATKMAKDLARSELESSPGAMAALHKVAAQYDVTRITPQQFSQMLEELRKTGALTESELSQLGQVLTDLNAEGVDSDEEIDLVKFYTDKLSKLQEEMEDARTEEGTTATIAPSLAAAQDRLNWLTKLAVAHSSSDGVGVNVLT
jgi:hypothetical protein